MRKLTALVMGMTLAVTALPAAAGVVITQKQHVISGTSSRDGEQTISVQGNKQKMVTERFEPDPKAPQGPPIATPGHTIITDLDKGMMYVLDPKTKTYFQIDFPPQGQMATMLASSTAAAMNFKKAGTTRDVAGYKCADYDGGGHMMAGSYTVKECFSTTAPGAQEFATFEKHMADKLKNSGTTANGLIPPGMPLALDSSMKMGTVNIPGMAPEQAAKINEMMAKRPPVQTSTVVEKVETKKLADSDFAIPDGFTKKDLPTQPMGMGQMKPGAMAKPGGPMMSAPAAPPSPAQ